MPPYPELLTFVNSSLISFGLFPCPELGLFESAPHKWNKECELRTGLTEKTNKKAL